ncbi:hypothetical protein ABZ371_15170 [Streptomyces sp. NPDC005899]|uniref:hypothetical protein n=1 Tax=Streptomyces sp. NPDC005899 TaxID=3155716 RepID=UPI0033F95D08
MNGLTFFAEDVFGFQFAVDDKGFHSFDPETGELEAMAETLDEWVESILSEYEELTGYGLAHAWQSRNGRLRNGYRLAPAVPFMLGGMYEVDALREKPDQELAAFRAHIYTQVRDTPDGEQVHINLM